MHLVFVTAKKVVWNKKGQCNVAASQVKSKSLHPVPRKEIKKEADIWCIALQQYRSEKWAQRTTFRQHYLFVSTAYEHWIFTQ